MTIVLEVRLRLTEPIMQVKFFAQYFWTFELFHLTVQVCVITNSTDTIFYLELTFYMNIFSG